MEQAHCTDRMETAKEVDPPLPAPRGRLSFFLSPAVRNRALLHLKGWEQRGPMGDDGTD